MIFFPSLPSHSASSNRLSCCLCNNAQCGIRCKHRAALESLFTFFPYEDRENTIDVKKNSEHKSKRVKCARQNSNKTREIHCKPRWSRWWKTQLRRIFTCFYFMRCKVKDCDMKLTPYDGDEVENYVFLVFLSQFYCAERKINKLLVNSVVRKVMSYWAIVYEKRRKVGSKLVGLETRMKKS